MRALESSLVLQVAREGQPRCDAYHPHARRQRLRQHRRRRGEARLGHGIGEEIGVQVVELLVEQVDDDAAAVAAITGVSAVAAVAAAVSLALAAIGRTAASRAERVRRVPPDRMAVVAGTVDDAASIVRRLSAAWPGAVERYDHVYTRNGVASLFMASEPLAGWRHVAATEHRCRSDWALFISDLLDGRYRDAERVVLVMDQLNTHSPASLYQTFPPAEAKRLADRLEVHHTPKHGSWLNMAEIELSALGRQCLARRIAQHDTLCRHIAAWKE